MENNQTAKYTVPMIGKALQLLEELAQNNQGLSIQELVELLSLPKTSVYRILNTFAEGGYLFRDDDTGKYMITRKLFNLGMAAISDIDIVERAIEPMRRLRNATREAVFLGQLVEGSIVLLEQMIGSYNFSFVVKPGSSFDLHASAPGKIILAYMDSEMREELLCNYSFCRYNENTITDRKHLDEELEKVRQRGYSSDLEEQIRGVNCIGAPIFNNSGNIHASIWVSGPSGRLSTETFEQMSEEVMQAARIISRKMGYTGG